MWAFHFNFNTLSRTCFCIGRSHLLSTIHTHKREREKTMPQQSLLVNGTHSVTGGTVLFVAHAAHEDDARMTFTSSDFAGYTCHVECWRQFSLSSPTHSTTLRYRTDRSRAFTVCISFSISHAVGRTIVKCVFFSVCLPNSIGIIGRDIILVSHKLLLGKRKTSTLECTILSYLGWSSQRTTIPSLSVAAHRIYLAVASSECETSNSGTYWKFNKLLCF